MNQQFYVENREKIAEHMHDEAILVMFAGTAPYKTADEVHKFTPNRNFYYLTGLDKEHLILVVTKHKGEIQETLYIERADPLAEKWTGKKLAADEAGERSGVKNIAYVDEFHGQLIHKLQDVDFKYLYLDVEVRDWQSGLTVSGQFASEMKSKYPYLMVENIHGYIGQLRSIKDASEVELIRSAIDVTRRGIENLIRMAKPGQREYELEAQFDVVLKSSGVKDYAFGTIVASGKHATVLHYEDNDAVTGASDLVLLDLGAQVQYYNADISRTFPINGKFSERQRQFYEIVLKIQLEVIAAIKPGVPYKHLNALTKQALARELIKIGKIENEAQIGEYYYHGVSHHLGLDTHDAGRYDGELQPGMVITVEPGLYIADEAIGIRIEDDVLVTETGHEVLSHNIIKTVAEIEAFMQK